MGPAGGKAKGCVYTLAEQADATPSARLRWSRSIGATSTRLSTGRAPPGMSATRLAFQDHYQAPIPRTTVGIVRIRIER